MMLSIFLSLVRAASFLGDVLSTPLYLEVQSYEGEKELINLKYHLIQDDLPLERLWIHPFSIPILANAHRSWKLCTTATYDPSLTYEIHPSLLQLRLPASWKLPFGPVPRAKLLASQEAMLMTQELHQMLQSGEALVYGVNSTFTELVDKHGLLQVMSVIDDAVRFAEHSDADYSVIKKHLRDLQRSTLTAQEMVASPCYVTLFWTGKHRSLLANLESFGAANHSQVDIQPGLPCNITAFIRDAVRYHATSEPLSLKASKSFLHYACTDCRDLILQHGHPDAFLEEVIEDDMLIATSVTVLTEYLSKHVLDPLKTSFLGRRLLHLLMQREDRTVSMEIDAINQINYGILRHTFKSIDAAQACRRKAEFNCGTIREFVCDQWALELRSTANPIVIDPLSTFLSMPARLLNATEWPFEWRRQGNWEIEQLLYYFEPHADLAERLLIKAFKYQWPTFLAIKCIKILSHKGLPTHGDELYTAMIEGKASESITTAYLLLVDPSKLERHVARFGWNWLANFYFNRLLYPNCLARPYIASLLQRTILSDQHSPIEDRLFKLAVGVGIAQYSYFSSTRPPLIIWNRNPVEAKLSVHDPWNGFQIADYQNHVAPFFLLQHSRDMAQLNMKDVVKVAPEPEILCQLFNKSGRLKQIESRLLKKVKEDYPGEYMAYILLRCTQ